MFVADIAHNRWVPFYGFLCVPFFCALLRVGGGWTLLRVSGGCTLLQVSGGCTSICMRFLPGTLLMVNGGFCDCSGKRARLAWIVFLSSSLVAAASAFLNIASASSELSSQAQAHAQLL